MKKLLELLLAEKELLSDPNNWVKLYFAADKNKNPISVQSRAAVCFCQAGAEMKTLDNVSKIGHYHDTAALTTRLIKNQVVKMWMSSPDNTDPDFRIKSHKFDHAVQFNDDKEITHDDLMEMYDICILHVSNCV